VSLADDQARFYGGLFERFGDDPRSLSHRDARTRDERFARLSVLFRHERGPFAVHDVGCGLGHFGDYLAERFPEAEYSGSEIHPPFVEACRRRLPRARFFLRDITRETPAERYDFVTLTGVFNIPLDAKREEWWDFIRSMARAMYRIARKGVAFDFLSTYCDAERIDARLHYQSEKQIADFVAAELSRHFELDNSGPLYEYTVRVYRPEYVRSLYPWPEFDRYFRSSD
jgi:SAM-dependent methyltransferase